MENFTFENWLKGSLGEDNYLDHYMKYEDDYKQGFLDEQGWKTVDAEMHKIYNAQLEAFDNTVDHNFNALTKRFEQDLRSKKNKAAFIQQTIQRHHKWITRNEHRINVHASRPDVSFFGPDNYRRYLKDKGLWHDYPYSDSYYYNDVNIDMLVHEKFLDHLNSLNPDNLYTLWDFFEGTTKDLAKLMDNLCLIKINGELVLQHSNSKYNWVYRGKYPKKHLAALVYVLYNRGWIDLTIPKRGAPNERKRLSDRHLNKIISNTFGCTVGRDNANTILTSFFSLEYTKAFTDIITIRRH